MNKETGGPAFPVEGGRGHQDSEGMTLRDYFAAKAMPAMLKRVLPPISLEEYRRAAKSAYAMADAMLEARKA